MAVTRGAKRAALLLASALLVAAPATAHATSGTLIGPSSLTSYDDVAPTDTTTFNKLAQAGSTGLVNDWSANFECIACAGQARLVVLAPTGNGSIYSVESLSNWETVAASGTQSFSTSQTISGADVLGVETAGGVQVRYDDEASGDDVEVADPVDGDGVGTTVSIGAEIAPGVADIHATYDPLTATTTDVDTGPSARVIGSSVTYTATVAEQLAGDGSAPALDGTVEFKDGSTTIPGCSAAPLVDDVATCTTTAANPRGNHLIYGFYSGDSGHLVSDGEDDIRFVAASTVTPTVVPDPVAHVSPVAYKAVVTPTPYIVSGAGQSASAGYGTVSFSVDDVAVTDCQSVQVTQQGAAVCTATSPYRSGAHELEVQYNGSSYNSAATGATNFTVIAPDVSAPDVDFGGVNVGATSTRTVTFTNHDGQAVDIVDDVLTGSPALAISADACKDKELASQATCDVTVTYTAADASAVAGSLTLTDDAGAAHSGALAGHGVAVVAPPTATPTPTPVAPKGGTLAPGAKPQLTVTVTPASSPNGTPTATANVQLACPAQQTCDLDGNITISTADFTKAAHAAAASSTTVAKFSKVSIAPGKVKTIKLQLSPAFIKKAQKAGVHVIHAVLTIHTTLGSGQKLTSQEHITVIIPRAAKKKAAAKVAPHFTG
jgi:hypothetical protein